MIRQHRPSLRISRNDEPDRTESFLIDVWNPFAASYQRVATVEAGLRRLDELANLIFQMWLHSHPKRAMLVDVPEAHADNATHWAEFRVNPAALRSYDTRRFDRVGWTRVAGLAEATTATCSTVGYAPPEHAAP